MDKERLKFGLHLLRHAFFDRWEAEFDEEEGVCRYCRYNNDEDKVFKFAEETKRLARDGNKA